MRRALIAARAHSSLAQQQVEATELTRLWRQLGEKFARRQAAGEITRRQLAALIETEAPHRGDRLPAERALAQQRLDWPQPRLALGQALRGLASAALDVSDGLLADLGHLAARSGVAAWVRADWLPMPACLREQGAAGLACAAAGGDDYELCFAAPPSARAGRA